MFDTNATMLSRANHWLWAMLICGGIWCLNVIALNMSTLGIAIANGRLSIQPYAIIQIPVYFGMIGMGIWMCYRYAYPLWICRTKRAGLSCPFCFHDLRRVHTEEAICPECGMRYTRTGLKHYWKKIIPAYFLRWSDRKLLRECGLSLPEGKPVGQVVDQPDHPDDSCDIQCVAHGPQLHESPPMRAAMLDTSATMPSRANRWLLVMMVYAGLWSLNVFALSMSATGIAITNGQILIAPYAVLQIPLFFGTFLIGAWSTRKYFVPIWISRTKRAGLSCPFCFHNLQDMPTEDAVCPECGMRYTRTGLKHYWQRIMPTYFLRWSDKKLLRECGLSMPDGDPVD